MSEPQETPETLDAVREEAPDVQPPPAAHAPADEPQAAPTEPDRAAPTEPEPAVVELVDAEKEALKKANEEIESRLRAVSNAYRTLKQEFDAFRQRTERLQEERDRTRKGEIVAVVFEPVQNLRRSIEAIGRLDVQDEVKQGLGMIFDQFMVALRKLGLEEITALGQTFDPSLHEALASVPVPSAELDGKVVQVFDTGFRIGAQVIQPARVVVGAYREPEA